MYDTNIYINANYNNININDSIYMHYVIALWCNDIQYIYTFVIKECVSGNINRDHCGGYTDELWHFSTYSVRTAGHFARFTPDSDFFSPHILYSTYSTHCLFPFTLVVNPLLTTIVHHIFSSVLAEPQSLMIFGGVLGLFSFQSFFFVGEVSVISLPAK